MPWLIAAGVVILVEMAAALWFWRSHWLPDWLQVAISAIHQGGPTVVVAITTPVVVAVAITLWWLWWRLPKRQADSLRLQVRDAKSRADLEDSFRKTVGQLIGGAAVLVGAGFAYYQFLGQQQTSQKQLKASYDQLISQQVSKGFEQLGSDNIRVRLGGIYALEGVMNNSEQYHRPVLEALCAFVRDGTTPRAISSRAISSSFVKFAKPELHQGKARKRPADREIPEPKSLATDIQAALTVIGRRKDKSDLVNLSSANISNANLGEANLRWANLRLADLKSAELSEANLSGAFLDEANLSGANLNGAFLTRANLKSADLSGANLIGAFLDEADLTRANLKWTDLNRAFLRGADLSDAENVSQDFLNGACGDEKTKLPPGLTIKSCYSRAPQKDVR